MLNGVKRRACDDQEFKLNRDFWCAEHRVCTVDTVNWNSITVVAGANVNFAPIILSSASALGTVASMGLTLAA